MHHGPRSEPGTTHSARPFEEALQALDGGAKGGVIAETILDDLMGVDDGGVVATAEAIADDRKRRVRVTPAEVHRHLPRQHHGTGAFLGTQVIGSNAEEITYGLLDRFDRDGPVAAVAQHTLQYLSREVHGDGALVERGKRTETRQRPFQLAYVRIDVRGEENRHLLRQLDSFQLSFLSQDRDARLDVGRLDVSHQAPFEAIAQPLFEVGNLLRKFIRGEHDLVMALVERVERVEEFFLRALATSQELHVVEDEHVDAAEAALE